MLGQIATSLLRFVPFLAGGASITFVVLFGALALALAGGLILALANIGAFAPTRWMARIYIELIRGTPALAQLFILYFGLSAVGIRLSPMTASIVGLGMNGMAYVAEIFRGGIEALDRGQSEAALSLGLTPVAVLRDVLLPQAVKIMVPSFCNYGVQLLKDTSLVSAVAAPEIMFRAHVLVSETYQSMTIYTLVALFYLAISIPLSHLAAHLQSRIGRS
jgi:His/Glu/Gln/Arg/opine family amino acid ABC transporter permease subunit